MFNSQKFNRLRICLGEMAEIIWSNVQLFGSENSSADQLQETAGSRFHVGRGVVGFDKSLVKKKFMKFGERWQFKSAPSSAGYLAHLGGYFGTGIQNFIREQWIFNSQSMEFRPHDIQIEIGVLADDEFCFLKRIGKPGYDFL